MSQFKVTVATACKAALILQVVALLELRVAAVVGHTAAEVSLAIWSFPIPVVTDLEAADL